MLVYAFIMGVIQFYAANTMVRVLVRDNKLLATNLTLKSNVAMFTVVTRLLQFSIRICLKATS